MSTLATILVAATSAMAATEIRLRDEAACTTSVDRLGDVADIESSDVASVEKLSRLPLMPAPAPGTERFLRLREIQDLLAAHGIDLGGLQFNSTEGVSIEAPAAAKTFLPNGSAVNVNSIVNRHAVVLANGSGVFREVKANPADEKKLRDQVNTIVVDYVDAQSGEPATYRVSTTVPDRYLAQLQAATTQPVCEGGKSPWVGRQQLFITFKTAAGAVRVPVQAEVIAKAQPAVVAIRPIARGEVITVSHLELKNCENVPKATDRRAVACTLEQLVGLEAKQAIQEGQMIFSDQVAEPLLVKRGDLVAVVAQSGGIRIRTTARAKQDGARGKLVQVETLDTHELYDVRIIGPRETAVFTFAASNPSAPITEKVETARR